MHPSFIAFIFLYLVSQKSENDTQFLMASSLNRKNKHYADNRMISKIMSGGLKPETFFLFLEHPVMHTLTCTLHYEEVVAL